MIHTSPYSIIRTQGYTMEPIPTEKEESYIFTFVSPYETGGIKEEMQKFFNRIILEGNSNPVRVPSNYLGHPGYLNAVIIALVDCSWDIRLLYSCNSEEYGELLLDTESSSDKYVTRVNLHYLHYIIITPQRRESYIRDSGVYIMTHSSGKYQENASWFISARTGGVVCDSIEECKTCPKIQKPEIQKFEVQSEKSCILS